MHIQEIYIYIYTYTDCSTAFPQAARALNSTHPPLSETPNKPPTTWNMDHLPPTLPHHGKNSEMFLCNWKCATKRWVGLYKPPVVTHSPLFTLDTFHTLLCVHDPTKDSIVWMYDYMLVHYKSPYTVHQPAAWLTMFLSAHVQYSFEAFVQFL